MPFEEAQAFAEANQMAMFIETSAKTADNINELFTSIAKKLPAPSSAISLGG